MDSGKTQTAAFLVKGLTCAGLKVGYAKITGTGAGGDTRLLKDAEAKLALDFTDAGLVSTYLASAAEVQRVFVTLLFHLAKARADAVGLELVDGVLQSETSALLASSVFRQASGGIFFAACDAMGAVAGESWLSSKNLPIVGLSGVFTSSPLQHTERTKATGVPVFARHELGEATTAMKILAAAGNANREGTDARPQPSESKAVRTWRHE